jgi:transcriptional regulator GlxA family with amidase domain
MHRRAFLTGAVGLAVLGAAGLRADWRQEVANTRIGISLFDGVEELDLAGPYEVLTAWGQFTDRPVEVFTVGDTTDEVRGSHGLRMAADRAWSDVDGLDVFVLPGGKSGPQIEDERFLRRLRELRASGTLMTSVCTGAVVYAAAGLLDGLPATTHWGSTEALGAYGKDVEVRPDDRFVDTGDVITSQGVSAGIDMALYLVKRLDSEERAREVRRHIQYDPEPPV